MCVRETSSRLTESPYPLNILLACAQNHFLRKMSCTSCNLILQAHESGNKFLHLVFYLASPSSRHKLSASSPLNRQILLNGIIVANSPSPSVRPACGLPKPNPVPPYLRLTSKHDPLLYVRGLPQFRKRRHRRAPQLQLSLLLASSIGNL